MGGRRNSIRQMFCEPLIINSLKKWRRLHYFCYLRRMKKLLLVLLCLGSALHISVAQCTETIQKRVLLVGDSWASFMNIDGTFDNVLKKWGHSNYTYASNSTIAFNGAVSDDFLDTTRLAAIRNELSLNPEIDLVHLSIGGNDVLGDWNVSFTQAQTDSLMYLVYGKVSAIIDSIKLMRPGIRVVWSGYVFPNFGEIISDLGALQSIHPFYGLWTGMGSPTFLQLNTILNNYSAMMDTLAMADPQVDFVRCNGLMQYLFGQTTALSVPPSGTYAPFTAPVADGFPDYPSPKSSMRNYGVFKDCFHLSPASYNEFVQYQTQKFYHKYLMDDQYLLSEGGLREGSVSASGIVSQTLRMGTVNGESVALVLSFNTTALPDTGISRASIFLRRESVAGSNPVQSGAVLLRISSGRFGSSEDVDAADFAGTGNADGYPCIFGRYQNNGEWLRLEIPDVLLPYITSDSITQFTLSVPNSTGAITFTGAAVPELAPVLNLGYGPATSTGLLSAVASDAVTVYPNPTGGLLRIDAAGRKILDVKLFDAAGKLFVHNGPNSTIDMTVLQAGMYLVHVITEQGLTVHRVVRQ